MIVRAAWLALSAALLCAAADPPPQLQPYIKDGQLEPGDYGWLKGRFADATSEERASFEAIQDWAQQCRETALGELRARLRERGHDEPTLTMVFTGPLLCQQAMFYPDTDRRSFAAFQQELAVARPVADAFIAAIGSAQDIAEQVAGPPDDPFIRQAASRRIADQALRSMLSGRPLPGFPSLSPTAAAIFRSRVSVATFTFDHESTEWLKAHVAEHGWPTISGVGQQSSQTAWLLAQHADADPLFQLQALELMEPLVAAGEVSKQNYAYLYDRVMLKLAGKQRYGTQAECRGGRLVPQPLEDEQAVNRRRREVGLGTVEEYIAGMSERAGACQSPPGSAG